MRIKFLINSFTIAGIILSFAFAGGTVTGKITYKGKVPEMKKLKISTDPACASKHSETPRKEWLLVDENSGVKNALVYVKDGLSNKKFNAPAEPVVLDQNGCIYVPHVLGIQVGQPLNILNNDGLLHNIHALPKQNREFNKAMPKFKKKITVTFDKPEDAFHVKCDVHPWMGSWIGVFDHPYFNVSGDDGTYTISGLDPGTYQIEVWHEKLGIQEASITIKEDETKTVDFALTRPPKKK